jgi:parallel beta-helix repeat protein
VNCNIGVLLGGPFANVNGGSNNHINEVVVRDGIAAGGTSFDGDGIVVNNGSNNLVNNNEVTNVGGAFLSAGIRLWNGSDNDVSGNTVNGLKAGGINAAGILLQGADKNSVHDNFVFSRPDGIGIWAQLNALNNLITGNQAQGNGTDLRDDNADCDNNAWQGNTFGSSNHACIQ